MVECPPGGAYLRQRPSSDVCRLPSSAVSAALLGRFLQENVNICVLIYCIKLDNYRIIAGVINEIGRERDAASSGGVE